MYIFLTLFLWHYLLFCFLKERKRLSEWRQDWLKDHSTTTTNTDTNAKHNKSNDYTNHTTTSTTPLYAPDTHSTTQHNIGETKQSVETLVNEMMELLRTEIKDSYGIMRRKFVDIAASLGVARPIAFDACEEMGFKEDFLAYPDKLWFVESNTDNEFELEFQQCLQRMFETIDEVLIKHPKAVRQRRQSMTLMLCQLKSNA